MIIDAGKLKIKARLGVGLGLILACMVGLIVIGI